MAKKKYYAVAKGRTTGIFMNWADCKSQIDHFPGAIYKGFENIQDAETFMLNAGQSTGATNHKEQSIPLTDVLQVSTDTHLLAYVDGSYEHSMLRYAFGCVFVLSDEVITLNGSGNDEDYVSMRNVAGEILGSEQAIDWAIAHGYEAITICYDYEGIEKWANDIWKANKPGTKRYKEFVSDRRNRINVNFHKVAAHTGVTYNEMADQMAKAALGIE